jgi:hypothetical protein
VAADLKVGVNVKAKAPAVPVIARLVKVATPATAATVVVPLRVPVPVAIVAITSPVKDVSKTPELSRI